MEDFYSMHTFLLPFTWDSKSSKISLCDIFSGDFTGSIWERAERSVQNSNLLREVSLKDMIPAEYNEFHYFNENSRNLFFADDESGLLKNFKIKNQFISDLKYIITKNNLTYELEVKNILLHIYSTNVSVLEIKCINTKYKNTSDVKAINEYGRRLSMPFWPENGFSKCADSLEFKGTYIDVKEDFKSFAQDKVSFGYVSKIIRELLNKNGKGYVFRAKQSFKENEIHIRTLIDDKMYVCCLIKDKKFAEALEQSYSSNEGEFDRETEKNLLELIYVDTQGSGKNYRFAKSKLYNSLFPENLSEDDPKLTAITEQAFIKIVGSEDYELEYFDNIYTKIVRLRLVQRISIVVFSTEIKMWTNEIRLPKSRITTGKIKKIMDLQEHFVTFQNQYMLNEITVKNEGHFLYDCLRDKMNVAVEYEDMEKQLRSLYELISTAQQNSFSKWGLVLSLIAVELSLLGQIITANDVAQLDFNLFKGGVLLVSEVVIALLIIWFVTGIIFKRKGKK